MTALDRALGALYGLAVGDALGMPTQALPRATVARLFGTLDGFRAGPAENELSRGLPAGHTTDDTDQALIVARCLVEGGGRVDPDAARASGCSTGSSGWRRPGRPTCSGRRPCGRCGW